MRVRRTLAKAAADLGDPEGPLQRSCLHLSDFRLTCLSAGPSATVAPMPQVTLRYTLWTKTDSGAFEREA
jgi:hypothetical protein